MKILIGFLLIAYCIFAQEERISKVESKQLWIRHTEPKGVGYRQGYTTLEAFLMASEEFSGFYPYVDLRAHILNDGRYASNIGFGGRALIKERIWGMNTYYDVRATKKIPFNQLSIGFETIGKLWDLYANGYLVIGRKNSPDLKVDFDHFENHFLFVRRSKDGAMSGADADFRFHLLKKENWDAYFDLGPYYYHGSFGQHLFGAKAGFSAILADLFYAEAMGSYDSVFKWIGQGILGFRFPLGKQMKLRNCSDQNRVLSCRLMQIPDHNEIIVVKRNHQISQAIDPLTGDPYFFWFVNNLSSSNGTFESPFPSLVQAEAASSPRHIIYVFQGDGTTNNMASGITLKDFQQLFGSGISQPLETTLGSIAIPPMTNGFPMITNAAGVGIALANHNVVSGMHVNASMQYGISGIGITDATIRENILTEIEAGAGDRVGLNLEGPGMSGNFLITGNTITGFSSPNMHGIFLIPKGADNCIVTLSNNSVNVTKDGVEFKPEGSSITSSFISSNTFISRGGTDVGFFLENKNTSQHNFSINGNIFSSAGEGLFTQPRDESVVRGTVANNQFTNSGTGYRLEGAGTSIQIVNVIGNTFSANTTFDFRGRAITSATVCFTLLNNQAPTLGYQIQRESAAALLNLTSFSGNVGILTDSGAFPFTQNPTCP